MQDFWDKVGGELRRICEFVGVRFQPKMFEFGANSYYGILGNKMKKKKSNEIRLDESGRGK